MQSDELPRIRFACAFLAIALAACSSLGLPHDPDPAVARIELLELFPIGTSIQPARRHLEREGYGCRYHPEGPAGGGPVTICIFGPTPFSDRAWIAILRDHDDLLEDIEVERIDTTQ